MFEVLWFQVSTWPFLFSSRAPSSQFSVCSFVSFFYDSHCTNHTQNKLYCFTPVPSTLRQTARSQYSQFFQLCLSTEEKSCHNHFLAHGISLSSSKTTSHQSCDSAVTASSCTHESLAKNLSSPLTELCPTNSNLQFYEGFQLGKKTLHSFLSWHGNSLLSYAR